MANNLRVDIRSDLRASFAKFELRSRNAADAATAMALNRVMTTVRAEAARTMKRIYVALKIGTIKRQMKFQRATKKNRTATIVFSGKRFRLFGNWPITKTVTPTGVKVRLRGVTNKGINIKKLPFEIETWSGDPISHAELAHAFIQRARTNKVPNVFVRVFRERYPIEGLVVPGLSRVFVEKNIGVALSRIARKRFPIEIDRALRFQVLKG
jgi:hypothetical protein